MYEVAATLSSVTGRRSVTSRPRSRSSRRRWRPSASRTPTPLELAHALAETFDGRNVPTTDVIEQLLGRPARSFETFARTAYDAGLLPSLAGTADGDRPYSPPGPGDHGDRPDRRHVPDLRQRHHARAARHRRPHLRRRLPVHRPGDHQPVVPGRRLLRGAAADEPRPWPPSRRRRGVRRCRGVGARWRSTSWSSSSRWRSTCRSTTPSRLPATRRPIDVAAAREAFHEARWVAWNAVRVVLDIAAFAALGIALVLHGRAAG